MKDDHIHLSIVKKPSKDLYMAFDFNVRIILASDAYPEFSGILIILPSLEVPT